METPNQFAGSLRKMLTQLIVATDSDIVLITPGPLPKSIVLTKDPPETYLRIMRDVGSEFNVPVVDMTNGINRFLTAHNQEFAQLHLGPENCHPNDAGHTAWAGVVLAGIEKYLPGVD